MGCVRRRRVCLFLVSVTAFLFVWLRARWVGHLLVWDEAMNLCSLRAFAAQGTDAYSDWFWNHPPLFNLLALLLRPHAPGLAERVQVLRIAMGVASLFVLYALNARAFDPVVALWSTFFLAVLPGGIFFGMWVKRDPVVMLFGLLVLHSFMRRRWVLCGLLLGLALLGKETALLYAGTLAVLWCGLDAGERRFRDIMCVALLSVLVSAWWYVGFSTTLRYFVLFMRGDPNIADAVWARPWTYYASRLVPDLGWVGAVLGLGGAVWVLVGLRRLRRTHDGEARRRPDALWPVVLLVLTYGLLSVSRGKLPWMTVVSFPAWATVQAVGVARVLGALRPRSGRTRLFRWFPLSLRTVRVLLGVVLVYVSVVSVMFRRYEDVLKATDYRAWWGAHASREAAQALNRLVGRGERALVTSFYYWRNSRAPGVPDPMFAYYSRDIPMVIRSYDATFDALVQAVREYRLDWALLSPVPGEGESGVLIPFIQTFGLRPLLLTGACVFRTKSVYESAAAPAEAGAGMHDASVGAGLR